jgi:hypothetical protein
LEVISRLMKKKNLDAMLITETHLEGDFERILPKGQLLIHHGPRVQPSLGAKGGVAVILSEDLATEWRKGKCKMSKGGEIAGTTRFMSISIKLKIVNSRNLSIHKKPILAKKKKKMSPV